MDDASNTAALIVAAGRGVRAGSGDVPKQYLPLAGTPILARTLTTFLAHPAVDRVLVVIANGDEETYRSVAPRHDNLMAPVTGGETRQDSVRNGLAALAGTRPTRVLIHDAARPFASAALIGRVVAALGSADAVVPAVPIANTLKQVDDAGRVVATVPRDGLQAAETPQGFAFDAILAAHNKAREARRQFTDDAAVAEWAGMPVVAVPGDPGNVKLTTAHDIEEANRRLTAETALALGDVRVGIGYDIHGFGPGFEIMLGGVTRALQARPHRPFRCRRGPPCPDRRGARRARRRRHRRALPAVRPAMGRRLVGPLPGRRGHARSRRAAA